MGSRPQCPHTFSHKEPCPAHLRLRFVWRRSGDPNSEYNAVLMRNKSGKRTLKEYGFNFLHRDTLWSTRDAKLDDVISEFGIPKSAAAAVMKIFEWDIKVSEQPLRCPGLQPRPPAP